MSKSSHLALQEALLPAASEWSSPGTGWNFLRIAQGLGYALRASSAHELSEGQAVVFAQRSMLTIRASQLSDLKLEFFHLSPDLLSGFFTLYEQHGLENAAATAELSARFLPASGLFAQKFARLCASDEPRHSLLFRARLLELAAELLNSELSPPRPAGKRPIAARERFEHLIQRMPAAEIQNRPVGELAEECGCSERHFSRIFRSCFGFSIRARQIEMRLQKARQMLQESDTRMIYVAMESGFRHLSLFNAVFKKRFGLTPSEWRRQNGQECRSPRIVRLS